MSLAELEEQGRCTYKLVASLAHAWRKTHGKMPHKSGALLVIPKHLDLGLLTLFGTVLPDGRVIRTSVHGMMLGGMRCDVREDHRGAPEFLHIEAPRGAQK